MREILYGFIGLFGFDGLLGFNGTLGSLGWVTKDFYFYRRKSVFRYLLGIY